MPVFNKSVSLEFSYPYLIARELIMAIHKLPNTLIHKVPSGNPLSVLWNICPTSLRILPTYCYFSFLFLFTISAFLSFCQARKREKFLVVLKITELDLWQVGYLITSSLHFWDDTLLYNLFIYTFLLFLIF